MRLLIISLSMILALAGRAQPVNPDVSFLDSARTRKLEAYNTLIDGQARLYNGVVG